MKRAILVLLCTIGLFALGTPASAGPLQEGSFTLTVKISGKGHVQSSPSGIDCPHECSADFEAESEVVLTEKPAIGWMFVRWEGCSSSVDGPLAAEASDAETCTVFMDGAMEVTAHFKPKPPPSTPTLPLFPLTVTVIGIGSVSSNPGGINCGADCSESYPQGRT